MPKHQAVKANTRSSGETPYPPKTNLRNSESWETTFALLSLESRWMNFHFPLGKTVLKLSEINWKQAQVVQVILIYNCSGVIQSKAM